MKGARKRTDDRKERVGHGTEKEMGIFDRGGGRKLIHERWEGKRRMYGRTERECE